MENKGIYPFQHMFYQHFYYTRMSEVWSPPKVQ